MPGPTVLRCAVAVAALALSTGCGSSSPTTSSTTTASTTSTTAATTSTSTTTPADTTEAAVYFMRTDKVGVAGRSVDRTTPARGAIEQLLAGPNAADTAAGLSTAIPAGTTLRSLDIAAGTATVDLSGAFATGGGSLSMQARVAQVVFTLTQFPTVERVVFRMDGTPVTTLGGEGLMIDQPQTRASWESLTPAILLERPVPGARITSPVEVSGTANTFEAVFRIALTDSQGTTVVDQQARATSGTGTRGTFRTPVAFTGAAPGAATLEVYEVSAKDGSRVNVVRIPVTL